MMDAVLSLLPWIRGIHRRRGVADVEVEDATQETLFRIARAWPSYSPPPELPPAAARRRWIGNIAARVAADFRNKAHHRERYTVRGVDLESVPVYPGAPGEARDLLGALQEAAAPEGWRTLVALAAGDSAADIARAEGVPLGTVYTRARRARLDIAAALARIAAADAGPMMPRKPLPPRRRRRAPKGER